MKRLWFRSWISSDGEANRVLAIAIIGIIAIPFEPLELVEMGSGFA